jgi:Domain of unknown function (DUF397)
MDGTAWRKASYSTGHGQCVEIAAWRVPARSNGHSACVEAGQGQHVIGVRDSKNPDGPVLKFTPAAWRMFLGSRR